MAGRGMKQRVDKLESMEPADARKPFLWFRGQALDDALSFAGLTLDQPVRAIRIEGVKPGNKEPEPDPLYERGKALLDS